MKQILLLLLGCLSLHTLQASDTLSLHTWQLRKGETSEWIPFRGAQNVLHVLRAAEKNPALKARFSKESRAFHDSVASLKQQIRCVFDLNDAQLKSQVITLELNYLQTFSEVWLNSVLLGKTDNAFRPWSFRIDPALLRTNGNVLELYFSPPREQIMHEGSLQTFEYPADNQADSIKTAPYIRQPQQEFGWDFAFPEIYTGFRVCPQLHFGDITEIRKASVETHSLDSSGATMRLHLKLRNEGRQSLFVSLRGEFGRSAPQKMSDKAGVVEFRHNNPALWWPIGQGNRRFYPLHIYLSNSGGEVLDSFETRYAVREVKLVQNPDSLGQSFYFEVNGRPVYMEGANVVMPNEPFENDRLAGLSAKELQFVLDSEMNMLRIWGGGTYLPDAFYQWADTAGIMVWQDLMFSCSYYPDHKRFEESVFEEVKAQSFRLLHHPSLALICGNNEVDVARRNWGWARKYGYTEAIQRRLDESYTRMFEQDIPTRLRSLSEKLNYLPSSPVSNWGKLDDFLRGDNHDWGIWHGGLPFDAVNQRIPRFMSEYGFPSFPSADLMERQLGLALSDSLLESLVLSYKGIETLKRYIRSRQFPMNNLEELVRSSQEVQQWHYRKMKAILHPPDRRCMGNLWWQLNDVSPVMSWSLLDMEGNPKTP
jgi:beta-mannosidase